LIDDADGRQLFGEFLRSEFSEENLEFWLACRQYYDCDDGEKLVGMAQQIYDDFVAPNAPREVLPRLYVQQFEIPVYDRLTTQLLYH